MSALLVPGVVSPTATTNESGRPPEGERPGHTGGAEGTRTPDPHTASVVRYQLRHSPLPTRSGVSEPGATVQADWTVTAQGWRCRTSRRRHPAEGLRAAS